MRRAHARARVVAAAREWIGTPYHHMADVKGVGFDCAMLLVRVFCDLGLVEPFDPRPTRATGFCIAAKSAISAFCWRARTRSPRRSPATSILFRYGRCFSHGGIVTAAEPLTIVHAFAPARVVLEEELARNAEVASSA